MTDLKTRLRLCREKLELTQEQLGKKAGIDPGQISHWETGLREPTPASLVKLNKVFKADIQWLMAEHSMVKMMRKAAN